MTLKEILNALYTLEGELDDAYYSIPEYDCNSDGRSSVDTARCTLYDLKDGVEKLVNDEAELDVEVLIGSS